MEDLSVRLVTWNVNEQSPLLEDDFSSLLQNERNEKHDLIIFGFQEINSMPQNYVMDFMVTGEDSWNQVFKSKLNSKGYVKVNTIRTLGIVLTIFSLKKHLIHFRNIETQYTKLAFGGYWGSKGAVSIRFNLYGVSFCFLNCHLHAHDENLQARIDGYESIVETHLYKNTDTPNILYHDYIFWMGDLNFRLIENSFTHDEIVMLIKRDQLEILHKHDQLFETQSHLGKINELKEGMDPLFPPTYKFKLGTQDYDPKRRPAYTDRILHRVNIHNYENVKLNAKQISYESHPEFVCSDHKPVSANFKIGVFNRESAIERKISLYDGIVTFVQPEKWIIGKDGMIYYDVIKGVGPTNLGSWDWIALFKAGFTSLQEFITFTWASSCKLTGVTKNAIIMDSALNIPGDYVLIYFSANKSILGISDPFPLVYDNVCDKAEEATNQRIGEL
ncbi:phosphatidylinositol 4,5-bisphosphate 5-phosphatase A [Lepeophtheirus salmonis]|uniref:phosphatidylinositol 4,5-bisphosphate 5-phosphatase A n=1 Tax=Lepeophtheirus salmonis TaxID=72036 RepID=UPI001AE6F5CF|nr:phosphatidylinositol 4,5-bisphosphate 5-phosphatase A-like [Lepeophtheirus salmonis]XP_040576070.1 phosphatidylinositol 4,5-bisphosphate 5-phosphatase A-like [Lepeophtheirus salmonis]